MFSGIRNKRYWLLIIAMAVALAGSASAQRVQMTDTGFGGVNIVSGTVLSPSGGRMEGHISVKLSSMTRGDRVAVTDELGNFGFSGLRNGDYMIVIDKEKDFAPVSQGVTINQMSSAPPQNILVSIKLKYKPGTEAKPGVINAGLANIPASAIAYYNKAGELGKAGDPKGAIEQLNLAIKEYPKFAVAYDEMGVYYMSLKDLGRADDAFQIALNIDKTSFAPLLHHGMALFEMKLYAKAEPVLREVIAAREDSAVGHYFLGQCLAYLGQFPEAQKELTAGMNLGGEGMAGAMKEGHRLLAIIYSTMGDKKRQAAELETYLKLAPNAPDAEQIRKVISQLRGETQ